LKDGLSQDRDGDVTDERGKRLPVQNDRREKSGSYEANDRESRAEQDEKDYAVDGESPGDARLPTGDVVG